MSSGGPSDSTAAASPRIGHYHLLDTVGAGSSGVVYRARHADTGRLVALKTARALDAGELRSLRREVHALYRMGHPGVVRIVDHGVGDDGVPWYAMELLEGETLRRWLGRLPRPLDAAARGEALRLIERLCDALAFVHGEGVVHRDLKPENVFLDVARGPVLVDFGLVMQLAGPIARDRLEPAGAGGGSLDYMAPEQLHGGTVDARADLYALGCILYEIFAGRPPFAGGRWVQAPPPPLGDDVPEPIRQLVARLLTWRARERLGHALDVAAVLRSVAGGALDLVAGARGYLYRPGFVGRGELVARMEEAFAATRHGRGEALFVGAPSGSGKTRLVAEAVALAAARGCRVVVSACESLGGAQAQPLQPLGPLLQAIVDYCRAAGRVETERVVGARGRILGAHWPELAALPGLERHAEPPPLGGRAGRERLLEALVDTILCFAERAPLVLACDDLQWADELTLALFERLADDELALSPLVLLGTFRSDEAEPGLRRFVERRTVLRLPPLDGEAIASIVADMLALDDAPPPLLGAVAAHAEGNPLFVAEYLRAAVAAGLLRRDPLGRWQLPAATAPDRVVALGVPTTLRELVLHRIARLGDGARRLCERAAVLGRELPLEWLEGLSDAGEAETLDAVNELLAREVLEALPHGRLRFVHDKLREVVYDELDAPLRRALHHAAARLIESRAPGRPELYAALAHHFGIAGVDDKTFDYLERAAARALELGAHAEAIALVDAALARDRRGRHRVDDERRARWHQLLGEATFAVGELRQAREHLAQVVELLHGALPRTRPRWAALLVGQTARQAVGLLRPRRAAASDGPRARTASLAAAKLAEAAYFTGDALVMLGANVLAANLAERAGSEAEVPRAYAQLGYTAGLLRLGPLAARYFARARGDRPADGDAARAGVFYVEALYHLGFGRWAEAEAAARRALALLASSGDRQENEIAQTMLAQAEFFSGRLAAAQSRFLVVRDSAEARRNRQHEAWGSYGAARSLLALGRTVEAVHLLDEADRLLLGQADRASEIICHGLAAQAALRQGDTAAARRRADRALGLLAAGAPTVFSTIHGYDGALDVYLRSDDAAARAAATRALAMLRTFAWSFPMARPAYLRHRAALAWRRGQTRRARRGWREAIAAAATLGMPLDEGLARLALGRSGALGRAETRDELLGAKARLSSLGCEYHLRLVEAELERVDRGRQQPH